METNINQNGQQILKGSKSTHHMNQDYGNLMERRKSHDVICKKRKLKTKHDNISPTSKRSMSAGSQ